LSVPLNGLFSARAAAMNFRNDHAVQTISDEFNQEGLPPIKTLAIECPLDNLPLTWRLTTTEVQRIARAASRSPVSERLAIVRDWLAGGSMRAWNEDRVVRRMLQAAPATGPALKPYLRYAISEEEDSSWMLFRDGYEFDGFEVLLVKELCTRLTEKLGLPTPIEPLRVGPIAWRRLLELPKRDEADIVLSSISFRPEREQRYELRFSTPYHQTHQVFAWMGESDTPPPFEHFAGGVAVQLDTTSHRLLNRLTSHAAGVAPQWPEAQVKAFATLTEAAEALKRGDARAILTEEPYVTLLNARLGILATAQSQIRHTDFDAPWLRALLTDTQERGEYYCIGMADDCPRLLWLTNTILAEMARDGTIPRLGEAARKKASLVIQPRS
jgi:ABC-type amino acid transport substrate-binding protein